MAIKAGSSNFRNLSLLDFLFCKGLLGKGTRSKKDTHLSDRIQLCPHLIDIYEYICLPSIFWCILCNYKGNIKFITFYSIQKTEKKPLCQNRFPPFSLPHIFRFLLHLVSLIQFIRKLESFVRRRSTKFR